MAAKIKNKFLLTLSFVVILVLLISNCESKEEIVSAWVPYWDINNSLQNIKNNFSGKIGEINLFFYCLDKDGNIINASKDRTELKQTINNFRQSGARIILTITNDIAYSKTEKKLKEPEIIHQVLTDNGLREKHIRQIMEIIKETRADGIDVDYESIDIGDKDIFTQFIKELSAVLRLEKKTLYVTVQHKTENHQRSGAGSADWQEISRYADRIIIMCYNYASKISKPGPICPSFWLKDIIKFAKSQIPLDKLCLALPFYGYDWSQEKTNSVNFKIAGAIIDKHKAKLKWDSESQTPYFIYYENGTKHSVWFENPKSILNKIKIIKKYKIKYLAFWHLGILDPRLSRSIELFLK